MKFVLGSSGSLYYTLGVAYIWDFTVFRNACGIILTYDIFLIYSKMMFGLESIVKRNALLSDKDTVPKLRLPFIKHGYRRPCLSPMECLTSVFKVHNETCNIWSHLISFVLLVCTYLIFFSEHSIWDPLMWPLLSFASLSSFVFLISSFAHTFCVMSPNSVGLKGWSDSDMDDVFSR